MALPRFFMDGAFPLTPDEAVPIPADELRHLTDVLRTRPGDRLVLVDTQGVAHLAEVVSATGRGLFVRAIETLEAPWEPHVTLVLGVAKGGKVDEAIQGAVEVGVEAVLPATFARDVVKLDPAKRTRRVERWRRVALAAAKQSQRTRVPMVGEPASLDELVAAIPRFDLVLVAWENEREQTVSEALRRAWVSSEARVAIVVGSEGGLTATEVGRLTSAGAVVVSLGPTILRAETAGVVAPALVVSEMHALHREQTPRGTQ